MNVIKLSGVLLVISGLLAPSTVLAEGPSPAKRASAIIKKQGYEPATAVTVYRSPSGKLGAARVKLMNGQVLHVLLNLKTNRIVAEKDLTAKANQRTALEAHNQGWAPGYSVENDPMGMLPAMTQRGNVRRFIVNYDSGAEEMALATFTPQGRLKKLSVPRQPPPVD